MKSYSAHLFLLLQSWVLILGCTSAEKQEVAMHRVSPQAILEYHDSLRYAENADIALLKAYNLIQEAGLSTANQTTLYDLQMYHHLRVSRKSDLALAYADSILAQREKIALRDIKEEVYHAYNTKIIIYLSRRQYLISYTNILEALQLADELQDECAKRTFNIQLGHIAIRQGKYRKSIEHYSAALKNISHCNPQKGQRLLDMISCLNNTGVSYERLGQLDSAQTYYQQAAIIAEKGINVNSPLHYHFSIIDAVVKGNLGYIRGLYKDFEQSEQMLKSSYAFNSRPGYDNLDALYTLIKLGEIYLDQNKIKELRELKVTADSLLNKLKDPTAQLRYTKLNARYYIQQKQLEKAGLAFKAYYNLRDQLDHESAEIMDINIEKELESLKSSTLVNDLQKEKQADGKLIFVLSSIILLCIVLLLANIRNMQGRRRQNIILKKLHAKLLEQTRILEKQAEEKDRIMKVLVHDIRSPINSLSGLAALIRSSRNDPEENQKYLDLLTKTTEQAVSVIKDLYDATLGKIELEEEVKKENLAALLEECIAIASISAEEKNIRIELTSNDEAVLAHCNHRKIIRVMSNLLHNAIKFSHNGGLITARCYATKDEVCVEITDQGVGIPESMYPFVFDLFTKARRVGTNGENPNGIGLSLCKQIIERHGGKIGFRSQEGAGTTFYFSLPL